MRLREAIAESDYQERDPVIPFFPFPKSQRQEGFNFLKALAQKSAPAALGLVYPGRQVLAAYPAYPEEPAGYWEWELFQFIYAFTRQAGLPVVLAIHYLDILRFGIIPYGQEGHTIGLDTLLVTGLVMSEAEGFTTEMAANGVGVAFVLAESLAEPDRTVLCNRASSFLYLPGAEDSGRIEATARGRVRLFRSTEQAPAIRRPGDGRRGWILEAPFGHFGWEADWSLANLQPVLDRLETWVVP